MIKDCLNDGVTLYHGDALGILVTLPGAAMDAVLTDPPYSSGGVTLGARQADPAQKYQQSGTKRRYPPMLSDAKDQRSWTMWCMLWLAGVYSYPVISAQKVHLTSKPVALIENLLDVTAPQETVLDPFMGGGSVGEACIRTGRSYVGMELSREYYDISRDRLTAALTTKKESKEVVQKQGMYPR